MLSYIKICRPGHWLKNIFIFIGCGVALVMYYDLKIDLEFVKNSIFSLIPASIIASAYYALNELMDAPFDRMHPEKKKRGIAAGDAKPKVVWIIFVCLTILGFALAWILIEHSYYTLTLAVLFFCALLYNIPPLRLKDIAFVDVLLESFNNPLRLWLGWYAVMPANISYLPPASMSLAWWFFGALLMTGKRYAEFRFLGSQENGAKYRASFGVYSEASLLAAMILYGNIFCFCIGIAIASYRNLHNLLLVIPFIFLAVIAYFKKAMSKEGARVEPENLLKNPIIILSTFIVGVGSYFLLKLNFDNTFDVNDYFNLMRWPPDKEL